MENRTNRTLIIIQYFLKQLGQRHRGNSEPCARTAGLDDLNLKHPQARNEPMLVHTSHKGWLKARKQNYAY